MARVKAPPKTEAVVDASPPAAVTTVYLESSVEIKDVEELQIRLVAALARSLPVRVDVRHVASIDTAGVQVLLAAQGEAVQRGLSLQFCGHSAALNRALSILGLQNRISIASEP